MSPCVTPELILLITVLSLPVADELFIILFESSIIIRRDILLKHFMIKNY